MHRRWNPSAVGGSGGRGRRNRYDEVNRGGQRVLEEAPGNAEPPNENLPVAGEHHDPIYSTISPIEEGEITQDASPHAEDPLQTSNTTTQTPHQLNGNAAAASSSSVGNYIHPVMLTEPSTGGKGKFKKLPPLVNAKFHENSSKEDPTYSTVSNTPKKVGQRKAARESGSDAMFISRREAWEMPADTETNSVSVATF